MLTYPLEDSVSQIFTLFFFSNLDISNGQYLASNDVWCVFGGGEEESTEVILIAPKNGFTWNHENNIYEVFIYKAHFKNILGAFVHVHGTWAG